MPFQSLLSAGIGLLRQWRLILLLQFSSLLLAAAPALVLTEAIQESVQDSLSSESLRAGYDDLWYRYFHREATGLAAVFEPSQTGVGGFLDGLDRTVTGRLFSQAPELLLIGFLYLLCWTFFSGGVLQALWRQELRSWPDFFADSSRYFLRLAVLGLLGLFGYALILGGLHGLLQSWIEEATRNLIDERRMALIVGLKYLFLWTLAGSWMILLDSTRIVVVSEDRDWPAGLRRGISLALSVPLRVGLLYLALLLLLAGFVMLQLLIAPGVAQSSLLGLLWLFLLGQLLFGVRLFIRLLRPASLMELYRERVG